MPVSEELTAEVGTAIDDIVESQKPDSVKQDESDSESSNKSDEESKDESEDQQEENSRDDSDDDSKSDLDDGDDSGASEENDDSEVDSGDDSNKKPEKKPDSEPTRVLIGDAVLAEAIKSGIDIGVARQFPSELSLQQAVASIDAAKEANKPEEEEVDLFENLKMDPEEFEPEAIKMYDALVDVVKKQHDELKELRNQTVDYTEQSATVNQEAVTREMTSWFNSQTKELGKDFHEALGEGEIDSLSPGSSQLAKRNEIANRMAISIAGHNAAGIQAPSREDLFQEAAGLVLKEEYQQISEKKLVASLKKNSSQHINRANSRGTKQSRDPMDETAAMLDKKYNLK